jgi:hypothetical protein
MTEKYHPKYSEIFVIIYDVITNNLIYTIFLLIHFIIYENVVRKIVKKLN